MAIGVIVIITRIAGIDRDSRPREHAVVDSRKDGEAASIPRAFSELDRIRRSTLRTGAVMK
jgi:hypothetical protein